MRKCFWRVVFSLLAGLFSIAGCGGGAEFTPPKTELTEEEKQQIKALNEQRQLEWGPTTPQAPESGS